MVAQSARLSISRTHERLVDLDLRKQAQLPEPGIARAEIVEHDRGADLLDLMQDCRVACALLQQQRFGDLELEPRGR